MTDKAIWLPNGFDLKASYALQALATGTANEGQQREALKYIVEGLCETYAVTFDPDNARQDAFNQGKSYVGKAIVQITKLNLEYVKNNLTKEKNDVRTKRRLT